VPEHLRTITPRLALSDGAAGIDFYKAAFDATDTRRSAAQCAGYPARQSHRPPRDATALSGDARNSRPRRKRCARRLLHVGAGLPLRPRLPAKVYGY